MLLAGVAGVGALLIKLPRIKWVRFCTPARDAARPALGRNLH
jgi:hypothetical protein